MAEQDYQSDKDKVAPLSAEEGIKGSQIPDIDEQDDGSDSKKKAPLSVEEVIEGSLGRMNCSQMVQAFLASVLPMFDNQQTFISVFTDAQSKWHCISDIRIGSSCTSSSNICNLSKSEWAWTGNKHNTIISHWDLQCASSFIKGLPATSFFMGCLLGGYVLASLGDSSLGRKNLLCLSCLVMSLASFASAFSPNIWVYSVLRFIAGVGRVSITISSFCPSVGEGWQAVERTNCNDWFPLLNNGIVILVGFSLPDSKFLMEHPLSMWLFMMGRPMEAVNVLKSIGSLDDHISSMLPNILEFNQGIPSNNGKNPFSSMKILVKRKWAIRRLIVTMVLSFGVGMMYFGMLLGVGGLGLNIYLSSTFNALLFLSSCLLTFLFWIPRCNRRSSVLGFCTISGAAGIIPITFGHHHKGIHVGLELIALFCACMVFNILFMYVVELFPTCIRNTAASLSRQALLLASVFVPVLVVIGRSNQLFSHAVFGVTILLCGLLVISLPETKGKVLCDGMEEQEAQDKDAACVPKL
ncbi:organic cation/carnitine transporter 3-like [Chenopodium quinoa]|uniref:Major facilitator superfamily (MFS) profile domain-containing protein n=1 Tax=Chenopodium quinoa TaxID=63459 RepID=A0A803NF25_CHEQI|nr:organic cation/carnitine transporter 3-like [Chenopodium quinoa]